MAHDSFFTNILFRLLNLIILLIFLLYVFKKHGVKMLKNGLEEHHATTARLNETLRMQKGKATHLYHSYSEREQLFEIIKDRIERWAAYRNQQQEQLAIEKKALLTAITSRSQRSSYLNACKQDKKFYKPHVLARAHEILVQRYADENTNREFVQQLLSGINKSVS